MYLSRLVMVAWAFTELFLGVLPSNRLLLPTHARSLMRSRPMKLEPGSDLRGSLEQLARSENASGYVLGVVGNLSRAAFKCPGQAKPTVLEGELEIITLNGTISPEHVHLHLSLSDGTCQVWGGHLEEGSLVLKGADILVGLLDQPLPSSSFGHNQSIKQHHPRLEIAVLPDCPWSGKALSILHSLEIPHRVTSIEDDDAFRAVLERTGSGTFPQVFVDGQSIGGYDAFVELHAAGRLVELK